MFTPHEATESPRKKPIRPIPRHVLKDAVVIVPRTWGFVVPYILIGLAIAAFAVMLIIVLSRFPIPWPFYLIIIGFLIILVLPFVSAGGSWRDVMLGYDTDNGQVVLVERQAGKPRRVVRIALDKVQAVHIAWLATNSSNPDQVRWIALLALSDKKVLPLHSIKGKQDNPPDTWLARFTQVSVLLGKPLEILPLPTDSGAQLTREQLVDLIVKKFAGK